MDPRTRGWIVASSERYGVDPAAALAVWSQESPSLRDGDNGTSFGPFQLHWGGAMPRKYVGNTRASRAFANSPAGVDYAIRKMAESGAKGKKGKAAITAIVARFERPADIPGEIAGAWSNYGQMTGLAKSGGTAPGLAPAQGGAGLSSALTTDTFKSAMAAELLAMSARTQQGLAPDFSGLVALAAMKRSMQSAPQTGVPPSTGAPSAGMAPSSGKFRGGLPELFYDPLGGVKHGQEIGAIGGHSNHVHIAFGSPAMRYAALQQAKKLGLTIREDGIHDDVDPVHTDDSNHYQTFPGTRKAMAADLSGTPEQMQAYYRWARATFT